MEAFWIPCEISQAIWITNHLAEWPRHKSSAWRPFHVGGQGEADAVFEAMEPRPIGLQTHRRIHRQAAIPERINDVIEAVDCAPVIAFARNAHHGIRSIDCKHIW